MALTMTQLRSLLDVDEPNYSTLAGLLSRDDIPNLEKLVQGNDAMLASKAAYAITLIDDAAAVRALDVAVSSPRDTVRVASAAGLRNLSGFDVTAVAERLLSDSDVGVRKSAIKSAQALGIDALRPKLEALANTDPEPGIRALAKEALRR